MNVEELIKGVMLKKHDFVTVKEWLSHGDNSYKGDCLEVMVIDLPFIRVKNHDGIFRDRLLTLNLDAVEITPLSFEFVQSVLEDNEQRDKGV